MFQESEQPGRRYASGFTLIELIIVITISAGIAIVLSLFLRMSFSNFRTITGETELGARVRHAARRVRQVARHSISSLCNWQNEQAFVNRAFRKEETLFFLTDMDQDQNRELHFIWFDRQHAQHNPAGTDKLIHSWIEPASNTGFETEFQAMLMPPDMRLVPPYNPPGLAALIAWLRTESNLNTSGRPTLQQGYEVLLDGSFGRSQAGSAPTTAGLPVRIARLAEPLVFPDGLPLPFGVGFYIEDEIVVRPGPPAFWTIESGNRLTNELAAPASAPVPGPYPKTDETTSVGGLSCQFYLGPFIDGDRDGVQAPSEVIVGVLTTLNPLLIPSAGVTDTN